MSRLSTTSDTAGEFLVCVWSALLLPLEHANFPPFGTEPRRFHRATESLLQVGCVRFSSFFNLLND